MGQDARSPSGTRGPRMGRVVPLGTCFLVKGSGAVGDLRLCFAGDGPAQRKGERCVPCSLVFPVSGEEPPPSLINVRPAASQLYTRSRGLLSAKMQPALACRCPALQSRRAPAQARVLWPTGDPERQVWQTRGIRKSPFSLQALSAFTPEREK